MYWEFRPGVQCIINILSSMFRQKSLRIGFETWSNFFKGVKKYIKKKFWFLHIFQKQIFGVNLTYNFLSYLLCWASFFSPIFVKFRQNSFQIWFLIRSNFFERFKKTNSKFFLLIFTLLHKIGYVWLAPSATEEGAKGPIEGPKGPHSLKAHQTSAGTRRMGI